VAVLPHVRAHQELANSGAMIFQAYGPGQSEHASYPAALAAARAGADFAMTKGHQIRDWIWSTMSSPGSGHGPPPLPPGTTVELGTGMRHQCAGVVDRIYALTGGPGGRYAARA
jgi:hypothetical protein